LNDDRLERWVLKLMGKADAELAADWIGSLLAHRLGLQCPAVDIAVLSEEALQTAPSDIRGWARLGPAFASREVFPVVPGISTGALIGAGDPVQLAVMYVLDVWLDVLDRHRPDGSWNLLMQQTPPGFFVIDFGKGLTSCLVPLIGWPAGVAAGRYPKSVTILLPKLILTDT
jgi:hypothetical protein